MSILDSIYGAASGVASAISQAVSPVVSAVTSIPAAVVSNISSGLSSSGQSSYNTVLASQPTTPNGETYVSTPQPVYIPSPVSNAFQSFISPVIAPTIPPVSIPSVIAGEGTQPLLSSLPQYAAPQTIPGKVQDLNAEIQAAGGTITDIGGKLYGPAAKGYQPVTPVYTTPAYQSSLAIKGMGEPITQEQEISSDVTSYVPYGNYAQTELKNTKIVSEPTGDVDIYQQTHPGSSLWNLVSSGSRAALQSGAFTVGAPETPIVYTQESGGTKLASSASVSEAAKIFANPTSYSRLGSEVYGGYVQPLTGKTVQETGAKLSTYANPLNLANLVSPTAVNLLKAELPTVSPPWSISASSPAIQELTESGLSGGVTPRSASVASAMPTQDISTLPAPFKSTVATTPPSSGGGPIEVLASNLFQGKLPSVGELWASTPIARIASNWTWKTPSTAEGWVKGLTSAPTVGTLSDQYQKTTIPTQKFLDTLSIIPGGSEIKEAGAVEEAEQLIPKFSMNIQDIGNIPKQYFNVEEMIPKSSLTGVEELKLSRGVGGALPTEAIPVIGAATLGGGALAYSKTLPNLQQVMSVPPSPGGATTGNVLTDTLNEIGGAYKMASGSLRSLEPGGSIGTPVGAFALDKLIGLPLSIISPLTGGKVWTPGADYMAKMGLSGTTESKEFNTQQANIEAQRPFYDALGKTIEEQKTQIDTLTAGKINAQGQFTGTDAEYAKIQAVQSSLQSNVDKYNAFQNKSQDVLTSGYKSGAIIKTSGGYEVAPEAERPYGLFSDWSNSVQKMLAGATPSQFETYEASPAFQNAKPYVNQDILNLLGPVGWLAGATINKPQFGEGAYRTITNPSEVIGSGIQGLELYAGGEVLGAVGGAFGAAEGVAPVGITQKTISILGSPALKYGVGGTFIGLGINSAAGGFNADLTPKVGEAKFASNLGSMTTNLYMMGVGAASPGIASRAVDYLPSVGEGARRVYEATNFPNTPDIGGWLRGRVSDIFTSGPKVSKSGLSYDYDVTPTRVAETGKGYESGGINQYLALPETTTFPRSTEPIVEEKVGAVGKAAVSSLASKNIPDITEGFTRLYRGETATGEAKAIPEWLQQTPEVKSTLESTGRWFTNSLADAKWYANEGVGKISYLDVPTSIANKYNVGNLGNTVSDFTAAGKEGSEFFLPKSIAETKLPLTHDLGAMSTMAMDISTAKPRVGRTPTPEEISYYTGKYGTKPMQLEGEPEKGKITSEIGSFNWLKESGIVPPKETGPTPTWESSALSDYLGHYYSGLVSEVKTAGFAPESSEYLPQIRAMTEVESERISKLPPLERYDILKGFQETSGIGKVPEGIGEVTPQKGSLRYLQEKGIAFSPPSEKDIINLGRAEALTNEIFNIKTEGGKEIVKAEEGKITPRKGSLTYLQEKGIAFSPQSTEDILRSKRAEAETESIFKLKTDVVGAEIVKPSLGKLVPQKGSFSWLKEKGIIPAKETGPLETPETRRLSNYFGSYYEGLVKEVRGAGLTPEAPEILSQLRAATKVEEMRLKKIPVLERMDILKNYEDMISGGSIKSIDKLIPQKGSLNWLKEQGLISSKEAGPEITTSKQTLTDYMAKLYDNLISEVKSAGLDPNSPEMKVNINAELIIRQESIKKLNPVAQSDLFSGRKSLEELLSNSNNVINTRRVVINKKTWTNKELAERLKPRRWPSTKQEGVESGKGGQVLIQKLAQKVEQTLKQESKQIAKQESKQITKQEVKLEKKKRSVLEEKYQSYMVPYNVRDYDMANAELLSEYHLAAIPKVASPLSEMKLVATRTIPTIGILSQPKQGVELERAIKQSQLGIEKVTPSTKSISDIVQKSLQDILTVTSQIPSVETTQTLEGATIQIPSEATILTPDRIATQLPRVASILDISQIPDVTQIPDLTQKPEVKQTPIEEPKPKPLIPVLPLFGGGLPPGAGGGGDHKRRFKPHEQIFEYNFDPYSAARITAKALKAGSNVVFGQKSSLPTFLLQSTQRPAQVQQKPPVRMMAPPPTQKKLSTPQFKMPIIGVAPRVMPKVSLPKFNIPMQQRPVKSAPRVAIKVSTPQSAQFKMPSIKTSSNTGLKSMSLPSSLPKKKKGKK